MSVGRNDPCPCGSGKKYKVCHGGVAAAPVSAVELLQQAMRCLEHNDHARAEAICRRILDSNPSQAEARHYLGMTLCMAGKTTEGLGHLRTSLTLRPMPPEKHNLAVFHNNIAQWLEKTGDLDGAETHYKHAVNTEPAYHQARLNLARLSVQRRKYFFAELHYRILMQVEPNNPVILGGLAETHFYLSEIAAMEQEYRTLIAKSSHPVPLHLNLGINFENIGRYDEARSEFEAILALEPHHLEAITHIAYIEEKRHRIEESEQWTRRGLELSPRDPILLLNMAKLHRRRGEPQEALDNIELALSQQPPLIETKSLLYRELGMIHDKARKPDTAFAAFQQANELERTDTEQQCGSVFYDRNSIASLFSQHKAFFTPERISSLQKYAPPASQPAPIFIAGFPRSGTTLVEQMLTTHRHIHAGDELRGIPLLKGAAATLLMETEKPYPECLNDVVEAGKNDAYVKLRDYYLHVAREARALNDQPYFTDKMPLNEDALGLIHLLFPDSPVIHVHRHPLDVILSCYFNQLSHGQNCSLTLETLAFHYRQIWELAEHYVANIPGIRYARVRYEDLIENPEREMRRLFEHVGADWEPRCLEFHKSRRISTSASYAQVNQPIYRSSQERWRPYRKHLEPIIPELAPLMEKLGYSVE